MKKISGFTLMELMTVIAIIAVIMAIAVPNLIAWRFNHQLNGSVREVQALINAARTDAMKNNAAVDIKIDTDNRKILSEYTNRVTGASPPPKEVLLRPGVSIKSENFTEDDDENAFSFNARGIPTEAGRIVLENSGGKTRAVAMTLTGTTRIE